MKIEELKLNPVDSFLHLERYVNQRNYSRFCNTSEVSDKYHPIKGDKEFKIIVMNYYNSDIISDLKSGITQKVSREKLFFIHPDSGYGFRSSGSFLVSPTSSTRTVLLKDFQGSPVFIKTSLPKRISRFTR
ncbi:hypothetical protein GF386_03310 [Candidatus Pacearchaeota archaeon]|nr:hypothetical protein [Candidatus Pacearchaeota archaeon]MBD3283168.1 hypothetical protein [Candidatus Pacearchaeota archaeon]